jgi:hypothetical protein
MRVGGPRRSPVGGVLVCVRKALNQIPSTHKPVDLMGVQDGDEIAIASPCVVPDLAAGIRLREALAHARI